MELNRIFGVFNYVITAVVALEQALPQSGFGTTKKQIILNSIDVAAKAGVIIGATLSQPEIAAIGSFIDAYVSQLNSAGMFKTAKPS